MSSGADTGRLPLTFPESVDVLPPFEDYTMTGRTYKYQTNGIAYSVRLRA